MALVRGNPDKYYLCFIHRNMYFYNSLELPFYASKFIYTYHVFSRTLMAEIIIYMYVIFFCPYINCCNHTKHFISLLCSSGLLHTFFLYLFIHLASVLCYRTKSVSRGSPCDVLITVTNMKTSTNPYHFSSHQDSKNQRKCYSRCEDIKV